ncbi:MBL fold metallo-hydrolase [Salinibacillus xinjiangensis]|uniref:MBL fold metallo-hydrolase n=1 Tax=Salinibacillus xinjiangensis TaxID=1229268 RepID=A0A6G1X6J1_9BACI|nr:MBL fold metallo-hydrolase [Salinibacillus xinjiangensis]MRG86584.1 MBL fold metallo-hydrolase [Salinibacillus xinjiangensis]
MEVKQLSLGPLGTNCYILHDKKQAMIVDPGGDAERLKSYIREEGLKPIAILLTHAHFDHIGAVEDISKEHNLEVYLHREEHQWLKDPMLNGSKLFGVTAPITTSEADHELNEGSLTIANWTFEVFHTPGHSPGSVSFVFENDGFVIAGDTLFQGGIGRTDLPNGNHNQLINSITQKLFTLDDETIVYPGHGPETTVGFEKQNNPFF